MPQESAEQRIRRIERKYLIAAIIWAIVAAIGFAMVILGSSPAWLGPVGEMAGIIGVIGTWFSILERSNRRNQEQMIRFLRDIRESLSRPIRPKRK